MELLWVVAIVALLAGVGLGVGITSLFIVSKAADQESEQMYYKALQDAMEEAEREEAEKYNAKKVSF